MTTNTFATHIMVSRVGFSFSGSKMKNHSPEKETPSEKFFSFLFL